jgi:hypothetical protein
VLLRELFFRESAEPVKKKLGRAFNHPEDLTFLRGADGAIKALDHIERTATASTSHTRFKWDGAPQVYWGWTKDGQFILCGHNGWLRGGTGTSNVDDFTNGRAIYNFILNKSGDTASLPADQQAERQQFAAEFSHLYDIFKAATKPPRKGQEIYFYADGLFITPPQADAKGVYHLHPNKKSKTQYNIADTTELGKRIAEGAQAMVVGHGRFTHFGADDGEQIPVQDFTKYITPTTELIIVSPYYAKSQPQVDTQEIDAVRAEIEDHRNTIEEFLAPIPKVSGFRSIIYKYMNEKSKAGQLANVGDDFMMWVDAGGGGMVKSDSMKANIRARVEAVPAGVTTIFMFVKKIMNLKNHLLSQLETAPEEIIVLNSEGWVQYDTHTDADHVKYVPRQDVKHQSGEILPKWTP